MQDTHWGLLVNLKVPNSVQSVYVRLRQLVFDPADAHVGLSLRAARCFQLFIVSLRSNLHIQTFNILTLAVGDFLHLFDPLVTRDSLAWIREFQDEGSSQSKHPYINVFSATSMEVDI